MLVYGSQTYPVPPSFSHASCRMVRYSSVFSMLGRAVGHLPHSLSDRTPAVLCVCLVWW